MKQNIIETKNNHNTGKDNIYDIMEKVVVGGDLSKLNSEERLNYYNELCQSLGLNPLSRPFEYIFLQNKLVLYARKDATEQLRKINEISIIDLNTKIDHEIIWVTVKATDKTGRVDIATGTVPCVYPETILSYSKISNTREQKPHPKCGKKLSVEDLSNAILKAETKAKRRLTLSMCGLGILDETEIQDASFIDQNDFHVGQLNQQINKAPMLLAEIKGNYENMLEEAKDVNSLEQVLKEAYAKTFEYKHNADVMLYRNSLLNKFNDLKKKYLVNKDNDRVAVSSDARKEVEKDNHSNYEEDHAPEDNIDMKIYILDLDQRYKQAIADSMTLNDLKDVIQAAAEDSKEYASDPLIIKWREEVKKMYEIKKLKIIKENNNV